MEDIWAHGDAYERYVGRWSRRVAPAFLDWLDLPAGLRWVDVGCGTGALSASILDLASPTSVVGVEPSAGFLRTARDRLGDRVTFHEAGAEELPLADRSADVVVSGLVLNFVPNHVRALREAARVADGGTVAAYVWDYADGMEFMRVFWDAAASVDPAAAELDEASRFPVATADGMASAFAAAGLADVHVASLDIPTVFTDFDDLWAPFLGGQGAAPSYVSTLDVPTRTAVRDAVRERVTASADGSIALVARAWAARGKPGRGMRLNPTMRAIIYTDHGDADVLQLVDRDIPEPQQGEVRVRIVVSGVNPTDWKSRKGSGTGASAAAESVPNQDGAGVIDAIGPGVTTHAVGDRVWLVIAAWQRPASGTAQDYTIVPAERAFPLPDDADFSVGASLGVPAVTAHRALTVAEDGPTRLAPGALAGRTVLVAGGAGAVGHAAIQLARWAGATVITTVSTDAKGVLATAAGAHHVVRYTDADAAAQILAVAPGGVDQVVEVAVASNDALNLAVSHPRTTIAIYANDRGTPFTVDMGAVFRLNLRYQFVLVYTVGAEVLAAIGEDVTAAVADGALPIGEDAGLPIHRFRLDQTADAHRAVEGDIVGKVLIDVNAE